MEECYAAQKPAEEKPVHFGMLLAEQMAAASCRGRQSQEHYWVDIAYAQYRERPGYSRLVAVAKDAGVPGNAFPEFHDSIDRFCLLLTEQQKEKILRMVGPWVDSIRIERAEAIRL